MDLSPQASGRVHRNPRGHEWYAVRRTAEQVAQQRNISRVTGKMGVHMPGSAIHQLVGVRDTPRPGRSGAESDLVSERSPIFTAVASAIAHRPGRGRAVRRERPVARPTAPASKRMRSVAVRPGLPRRPARRQIVAWQTDGPSNPWASSAAISRRMNV